MFSTGLRVFSCAALESGSRCSALGLEGARRARCRIDAFKEQLHDLPRPLAYHLKMEISLEESFPLPNLNDIDLSELSCDETPSPTSSTEYSPLSSPPSLDISLDSPMSTNSNGSCQPNNRSTDSSPPDKPPSRSSKKSSKHRAKCNTSQCIKKEHISILRRNERERNRVKLVSDGFATLRKHVPTTPVNKKLSKVDTLRTAIEYIRHLQKVLNESNRIERERRLMRQVGWFQEAYKLQAHSGMSVLQQHQINSLLMELPDIVPYPSSVQVRPSPMGYSSYLSSMSLNQ